MSTVIRVNRTARPLGEVARFLRGITFKPEDVVEPGTEGSVVCMRTKNVQTDLDQSDMLAVPSKFIRRDELYLRESDILVSTANSWDLVGKCSWVPRLDYLATAGGFISILRADPSLVVPRYLYYWFNSDQTQHAVRLCGRQTTNISNMSYERCESLKIPLPPLPEQRRIAEILDKAAAIRRKGNAAIQLLNDVVPAAFNDLFGAAVENRSAWPSPPLATLLRPTDKINYGVVQPGADTPGGVPLIRVGDLLDGAVRHASLKRIATDIDEKHAKSRLAGDEVLLVCVGVTIGKIALCDPSLRGFNIARAIARIPCGPMLAPRYLATYLALPYVQGSLTRETRTVAQPTLNIKQIEELPVVLPPIDLQNKFSNFSERTAEAISHIKAAAAEQELLFNSLVQLALNGEL